MPRINGPGELKHPVRQSALAVVNVSDYGKIPDSGHVYGNFSGSEATTGTSRQSFRRKAEEIS